MKHFYSGILLLFAVSCTKNTNVIKSINDNNTNFIWYRDNCGSNGCDLILFKNDLKETIIYKYYDFALKDINLRNDTLLVYYSKNTPKDLMIHIEGDFYSYHLKYVKVPANMCNYQQIKNNSTNCSKNLYKFYVQAQ